MQEMLKRLYGTRKAYLLVSILSLAVIAVLLFLVIGKLNEMFNVASSMKKSDRYIFSNRANVDAFKRAREELEASEKRKLGVVNEAELLKDISDMAQASGCDVTSMKPGIKQLVGDLVDIEEFSGAAVLTGTYQELSTFLKLVSGGAKTVKIDKFTIREGPKRHPQLLLNLWFKAYPFNNEPKPAVAEGGRRDPFGAPSVDQSGSELAVTGIIRTKRSGSYAIIKKDGKSFVAREGDTFGDGIKVMAVFENKVVCSSGEKKVVLEMKK